MAELFLLLVIYQVKHFLCDFPLQTSYMLGKFKESGWAKPLAAHAGVHALFTYLISLAFGADWFLAFLLAYFDFVVHFTMDRVKASPNLMGRWKALSPNEYQGAIQSPELFRKALRGNQLFWWALGIDQAVHHLTHYAIIAVLVYNA